MKSEDNNKHLDALDVYLKEYLLSRDPKGFNGESLMASAMEGIEETPPSVSPSPEKEAELLSALQQQFSNEEEPVLESHPGSLENIPLVGVGESPMESGLKEYLIEQDPKGINGQSLMFAAMKSSSVSPSDVPSPEQKARMLNALKAEFAKEEEDEKPVVPFWSLRNRIIVISLAAAAAVALFLLFNPFKGEDPGGNLEGGAPAEIAGNEETPNPDFVKDKGPLDDQLLAPDNEFIAVENSTNNGEDNTPRIVKEPRTQETPRVADNRTPNPKVNTTPEIEDYGPYPLMGIFARTSQESQWFSVNNKEGQLIEGAQGTRVYIPADCFVDPNGKPVDGTIALELKEVYTGKDFLLSNLPTQRDGDPLVSGGSIFLEARNGPEVLQVANDKQIFIEPNTPANVDTRNMQLYAGNMTRPGEVNWSAQGTKREALIPLSLQAMQLEELYLSPEEIDMKVNSGEATKKQLNAWNRAVQDASSAAYSDSWVHTREFLVRMIIAHDFDYDAEIIETYTEESDSALVRADRIVAQKLRDRGDEQLARVYDTFAAEGLGYAEKFRTYGIDFDAPDAREKLAKKKFDDAEIDRLMRVYDIQQVYEQEVELAVAQWKKRNEGLREMIAKDNRQWKSIVPSRGQYQLQQTGWANLNKPLPTANNVKLQVSHTGDLPQSALNTYMVFQGMPSMIKAENTGNDQVRFEKVPKNVEGWIVSMGFQNAQPYFGYKRVKPGKDAEQRVVIRKTSMEALRKKLNDIL